MNRGFFAALALLLSFLWPTDGRAAKVSVLIDLDPGAARCRQEPDRRPAPGTGVGHLGPHFDVAAGDREAWSVNCARSEVIIGRIRADHRAGEGISGRGGPALTAQGETVAHLNVRGKIVVFVETVRPTNGRARHGDIILHEPRPAIRRIVADIGIPELRIQRSPGEVIGNEQRAAALPLRG